MRQNAVPLGVKRFQMGFERSNLLPSVLYQFRQFSLFFSRKRSSAFLSFFKKVFDCHSPVAFVE